MLGLCIDSKKQPTLKPVGYFYSYLRNIRHYFLLYIYPYTKPTKTAPPKTLPIVAGIKLFIINCPQVISTPLYIAAGIKNILAIECS